MSEAPNPSGHDDRSHVTQSYRHHAEAMAGYGLPEAGIAKVLAIDPDTLRRDYAAELDRGQLNANAKVAENLYRKATGEGRKAVTAAIFWLKTRLAGRRPACTK
jgi:hypothetical protein